MAALLLAGPASAADVEGRFSIEGVGKMACARFAEVHDADAPEIGAVAAWVDGYVTAHNRLMRETFDLTPWQTSRVVLAQLGQYCVANPDASLEAGASELIAYLGADRLRMAEDIVGLSNGRNAVFAYASVIASVESALGDRGHPIGSGENATSKALEAFQRAQRMEVTGLPDQNTLLRLFSITPER